MSSNELGFTLCHRSGFTIAVSDIHRTRVKKAVHLDDTTRESRRPSANIRRGLITEEEQYNGS